MKYATALKGAAMWAGVIFLYLPAMLIWMAWRCLVRSFSKRNA